MKKILLAAAAVIALAGCQSLDQLRALAPQQSDYEICRAMVLGGPSPFMKQAAAEERDRRRLDCTPHMAAISVQQQASAASMASGLQLLQMSRPQPVLAAPLLTPQVNCISRPSMGAVHTTCH